MYASPHHEQVTSSLLTDSSSTQ